MRIRARKSHRLRTTIIILMTFVTAVMALLYFLNTPQDDATPSTQPKKMTVSDKSATEMKYGLPMRLSIPKLKVEAPIAYMGLTTNGEMDVPPDLVTVGWYKFGTKPGDQGSAVIAGHLEGMEDMGVFADLVKLRSGDIVTVQNDRDEVVSFAVRETRTYKKDERPSEIFNRTDGSYLNLITCSGTWNNVEKRYSHRYVVFAEKIVQ